MLTEFPQVRQIPQDGYRRWFTDSDMDLILWYEEGLLTGFQLCYDKGRKERALTWRQRGGWDHLAIDSGDRPGGPKRTPILVADGTFQADLVGARWNQAAAGLEPSLRRWLEAALKAWPGPPPEPRPQLHN